ncbi:TetR/AcrR family transcriptional regulator [Curtobacterium sp. VKM Ac-1395]|uniref:TetR/AcrR family transcriptional regulator n=1 Tax=Curtobacterium sp. VKM Ac-1395 TaxID=2783815 RepID=UPI001E34B9D9|nr:TetR/AcrR family transcriptional regulator [Curtobacterium sp. VKM Ac-1395]
MRADAERNRHRITEHAAVLLRASGTGVSMEQIASDAGVGVGTLYRHFPDKAALVDAIAALRIRRLADDAVRFAGEQADERSRVRTLLEAYMASAAEDGALRAALRGSATGLGNEVRLAIEESEGPIGALIAADQAQGFVRDDFSFADFRAVCAAVVSVMNPPAPTDAWHRVLTLVLTGLRPPAH